MNKKELEKKLKRTGVPNHYCNLEEKGVMMNGFVWKNLMVSGRYISQKGALKQHVKYLILKKRHDCFSMKNLNIQEGFNV